MREVQNEMLRPVNNKAFLHILIHNLRVLLLSSKKILIGPEQIFLKELEMGLKTSRIIYVDFRSDGKIEKKKHAKQPPTSEFFCFYIYMVLVFCVQISVGEYYATFPVCFVLRLKFFVFDTPFDFVQK